MMRPGPTIGCWLCIAAMVAAAAALVAAPAGAQPQTKGPANALQGFSTNRDKPVRIQAASLEVRDKEKVATFEGNVQVTQGDTEMRCKSLVVFYESEVGKSGKSSMRAAEPGPAGQQQIRRMEAKGGVVVTQKDQIATGDSGEFDMRTNTVTLLGNVVVTRAQDVLRGRRLVVNLTDGVSKIDSGGGRVDVMIAPRQDPSKAGQPSPAGPLPRPSRPN